MKKTVFFGALLVFVPVLFLMAGSVTVKAETIELKFAHFMSPKHIQHQKSFDPFTQKVAELTNGQVQIKIYPGGALGNPKQLPDAVKTGMHGSFDIIFSIGLLEHFARFILDGIGKSYHLVAADKLLVHGKNPPG